MADSDQPERRTDRRRRVLKRGTILNGVEASEVSCAIRNMDEHGALLQVPAQAPVPKTFLLYVPSDGVAYLAERRWRSGDRVGVLLQGTAPKPHWHYG